MCVWGGLCVDVWMGCVCIMCVCVCVRKYNIRGSPISKVAGTQHSAWKVPPVLDFPLRKHATDIQCMNTHTHTTHTYFVAFSLVSITASSDMSSAWPLI